MQIESENVVRGNLRRDIDTFQRQERVLNDKISQLKHLIAQITEHLSAFEANQSKFQSLYNPVSEWAGTKRKKFSGQMDSDTLPDYHLFLNAVRGLKDDVQDEIRTLNASLDLCQTDIHSLHASLNALKNK
ncbi:MAG: DUF5082 family protein [Sporolactobacillus sp.]